MLKFKNEIFEIELISNFKSIRYILYLFVSFPIESDSISHLIKQKSQHVKLSQQFLQNATAWLENKIWRNKRNQKLMFLQNPSWSMTEVDMIIILYSISWQLRIFMDLLLWPILWIFSGHSENSASPDWRPLNVWMWYGHCFRRIWK